MGFFDRLFRRKERALSLQAGEIAGASFGAHGPPRRGTRELMIAYREQPWLRAVTSRIARGVASAGWTIYTRAETPSTGRGASVVRSVPGGRAKDIVGAPAFDWRTDRAVPDSRLNSPDFEQRARRRVELSSAGLLREVPDHPLLKMLCYPNVDLTGRQSIQMTQTWLDLKGEGFWLLQRDELGVPCSYSPVPPHWVIQVPSQSKPFYRVSHGTMQFDVPVNQMVWFRDPDPENPYGRGTGVAESLGDELETDEFAAKYLKNWFFNSAMPSLLVSFEGAREDQLKLVKEKWEQEHRGFNNAHRAHFASGKMNAVRLDASFRDQQIADLRKLSRDTIAQVFAMPPEILGIIENSNRSTIGAARYIYSLGVEFPRCEALRAELQHQLVPMFDDRAVLECEVAIPDDEERRLNVLRAMPGAFSLNEWRSEAAYEPLPQFEGVFPPLAMPGQIPSEEPTAPTEKPKAPPAEEVPDEKPTPPVHPPEESSRFRKDPPWAKAPIP